MTVGARGRFETGSGSSRDSIWSMAVCSVANLLAFDAGSFIKDAGVAGAGSASIGPALGVVRPWF